MRVSAGAAEARVIRCPGCGGPSVYSAENAFRPFCSARCKNNDFGAWASEGYAVPADPDPDLPEPDLDRGDSPTH
ncbi:MAG: DNA gyrase inhibitor YacG [Burkholderiaceae bacterium]